MALAAPFVPVGVTYQPGQKGAFCPSCKTREKRAPGVPGWETGTTGVSQPRQINVFVAVFFVLKFGVPERENYMKNHK